MGPTHDHKQADLDLVEAARGGDRAALDALLRRHYDRVYGLCRRLCGNPTDAADATQEALITIARRLDRFDGRAAFATWAYRVATNACLDELRRRRRRPDPIDDAHLEPRLVAGAAIAHRTGGDDPATTVTERAVLDDALSRLPAEFRVAVVLRDQCGLDYAEIAEVVGIPIGTVRSRIARARLALARELGNQPGARQRQSQRTTPPPTPQQGPQPPIPGND